MSKEVWDNWHSEPYGEGASLVTGDTKNHYTFPKNDTSKEKCYFIRFFQEGAHIAQKIVKVIIPPCMRWEYVLNVTPTSVAWKSSGGTQVYTVESYKFRDKDITTKMDVPFVSSTNNTWVTKNDEVTYTCNMNGDTSSRMGFITFKQTEKDGLSKDVNISQEAASATAQYYIKYVDESGKSINPTDYVSANDGDIIMSSDITQKGIDGYVFKNISPKQVEVTIGVETGFTLTYTDNRTMNYKIYYVDYDNPSTEISSSVSKSGKVGDTVTYDMVKKDVGGWIYNTSTPTLPYTIKGDGSSNDITLKYKRSDVSYTIYYIDYDTRVEIEHETRSGQVGQSLSLGDVKKTVSGYSYKTSSTTFPFVLQADETKNVITLEYEAKTKEYEYYLSFEPYDNLKTTKHEDFGYELWATTECKVYSMRREIGMTNWEIAEPSFTVANLNVREDVYSADQLNGSPFANEVVSKRGEFNYTYNVGFDKDNGSQAIDGSITWTLGDAKPIVLTLSRDSQVEEWNVIANHGESESSAIFAITPYASETVSYTVTSYDNLGVQLAWDIDYEQVNDNGTEEEGTNEKANNTFTVPMYLDTLNVYFVQRDRLGNRIDGSEGNNTFTYQTYSGSTDYHDGEIAIETRGFEGANPKILLLFNDDKTKSVYDASDKEGNHWTLLSGKTDVCEGEIELYDMKGEINKKGKIRDIKTISVECGFGVETLEKKVQLDIIHPLTDTVTKEETLQSSGKSNYCNYETPNEWHPIETSIVRQSIFDVRNILTIRAIVSQKN